MPVTEMSSIPWIFILGWLLFLVVLILRIAFWVQARIINAYKSFGVPTSFISGEGLTEMLYVTYLLIISGPKAASAVIPLHIETRPKDLKQYKKFIKNLFK